MFERGASSLSGEDPANPSKPGGILHFVQNDRFSVAAVARWLEAVRHAGRGGPILCGGALCVQDALGDDDGYVSGSGLSRI